MNTSNILTQRSAYKVILYVTLILAAISLVAELLPEEIESKSIVIPALILIISVGIIDLFKLKKKD